MCSSMYFCDGEISAPGGSGDNSAKKHTRLTLPSPRGIAQSIAIAIVILVLVLNRQVFVRMTNRRFL